MTEAGLDQLDALDLPATPASARAARRHVRGVLERSGRAQWSGSAELAVSEVVTNALLHAHTVLRLRVSVRVDEVLVEVQDGSPVLTSQHTGQEQETADDAATTGRGLALLSAVTRSRGVRTTGMGKVVWFTVGDEPAPEEGVAEALPRAGAWDLPRSAPAADSTSVRLLGLPPTLWSAARAHHQALLRELVLYLAEHEETQVGEPELTVTDQARSLVWMALQAELDRTRAAGLHRPPVPQGHPSPLTAAPPSVDLELLVPPSLGPAFATMQDVLDTAERLAVHDRLLVRPGLPEIIALRDWVCEQVVAQLAGVPASPWGGADQEHFTEPTHDRSAPAQPEWDSSTVTESTRGVVAADDANRIIAVSASLARLTGWDPAELVGRRVVALIPPLLREVHVAGFSRHLTTGQSHVLDVPLELPVQHRDGHELACSFLVQRVPTSGRPVYLAWIEALEDRSGD